MKNAGLTVQLRSKIVCQWKTFISLTYRPRKYIARTHETYDRNVPENNACFSMFSWAPQNENEINWKNILCGCRNAVFYKNTAQNTLDRHKATRT
jgi:hypothetical protein